MTDIAIGILLGACSVLLHLLMSTLLMRWSRGAWLGAFLAGLLIRFGIVAGVFTAMLVLTEIEPLGFTLSFVISYIFWSVNEALWLHRKERRRTETSHTR